MMCHFASVCDKLTDSQCNEITLLHAVCSETGETPKEGQISVLSLVLPEPEVPEEDVFYALYYKEKNLVSFLSVFCPDGKTAEISGFTHPAHRTKGYFSLLLDAAKKEAKKKFGQVSFFYQCLAENPDTKSFCRSKGLIFSHSECMMAKKLSRAGEKEIPLFGEEAVFFHPAAEKDRDELVFLHEQAFSADSFTAEAYMDTVLSDPSTSSFLICTKSGKAVGLFHLTKEESGRIFYFMGLGILPGERRKGYAKKALMLLFSRLFPIQDGPDANDPSRDRLLLLQVSTENHPAFRLYESLGFYVNSRLDYYREP